MVLKSIKLTNVQCHKELFMEFPKGKLIRLAGANSNGKSVVVKITKDLIFGNISKPKIRASLISRSASYCEAVYTRDDDTILTAHITREASGTWVSLHEPGYDPVTRFLSDKQCQELVLHFGFHLCAERDITLNIGEADDSLLFFKTSHKANMEVLETALSDPYATHAIEALEQLSKTTKDTKDTCVNKIVATKSLLKNLPIYDIDVLRVQRARLAELYRNLSAVYFPTIPEIEPVPNVKFHELYVPRIPEIKYPRIYDIQCRLPDILPIARDIKILKENRCPTCGRGF